MKDTELRGLLLQRYYESRRGGFFLPTPSDAPGGVTERDILDISTQLAQHALIEWIPLRAGGHDVTGMGKITALGVDVVEGKTAADVKVEFVQHNTINITGSSNVVVGDNNNQLVKHHVGDLLQLIESASASPAEKNEAKSLLRRFLEHPLIAALAGGAIGLLGK